MGRGRRRGGHRGVKGGGGPAHVGACKGLGGWGLSRFADSLVSQAFLAPFDMRSSISLISSSKASSISSGISLVATPRMVL